MVSQAGTGVCRTTASIMLRALCPALTMRSVIPRK